MTGTLMPELLARLAEVQASLGESRRKQTKFLDDKLREQGACAARQRAAERDAVTALRDLLQQRGGPLFDEACESGANAIAALDRAGANLSRIEAALADPTGPLPILMPDAAERDPSAVRTP